MRILIADSDGGYGPPSAILGRFLESLVERTGAARAVRVQWPAPGVITPRRSHTWETAAAAGVADLNRLVRLHPSDLLVLVGVCSGSRVIYDWLEANPEQLDRVAVVGMVGDPFRPRDKWLPGTQDPGGQGVAGRRLGPIPDRTYWVAVPGDPLSAIQADSLLRSAVRGSDLAPDQVYDDILDDLPGSRAKMAARLDVLHHPGDWATNLRRRVDEAREALERYRSLDYATRYESNENGPSPYERLVTLLAAEASRGGVAGSSAAPPHGRHAS